MTMAGLSTTINAQVTIDETNFPDPNFRSYLLEQSYGQDGIITDEEIAEITTLSLSDTCIADFTGLNLFTSLDLSNNPELSTLGCRNNLLTSLELNTSKLKVLSCGYNQLTSLDLSNCPELEGIQCNNNQLSDQAMFDMVISLPDRSETTAGNIYAIDLTSSTEKNVCTTTTVGVARAINWYINAWTENGWEEYEGSDPTGLNEIDAAKMGNGTRYNLMGQPVGNDYKGIVIENGQKFIVR